MVCSLLFVIVGVCSRCVEADTNGTLQREAIPV
jgi:hypothetical protein